MTTPEHTEQEREPCQVVTVFSAKGGTGKTTIATNLAVTLQAATNRRVCLVDLDLAFGDVAICMHLTPERTLIDAVDATYPDRQAKIDALVTAYRPGLDCILAPVGPGDAERIPAAVVDEVVKALRERYDYVVIDTPSQLSEHVLAALDRSDQHVLLTTPELPALKNLRLTLDMLDLLSYPRDARALVFNRSDDDAGLQADEIEETLKYPIAANVPASRDVPVSINRGVPLAAAKPDHAVSRAIRRLAELAIPGVAAPELHRPRARGLRRKSA
jgi:pilus assembly protein CpaE